MKYKIKKVKGNTHGRIIGTAFFTLFLVSSCVYLSCVSSANKYVEPFPGEKTSEITNISNQPNTYTEPYINPYTPKYDVPTFYADSIDASDEFEICRKSVNLRFPSDEIFNPLETYFIKGRIYLPLSLIKEKLNSSFEPEVRQTNGIYSVCLVDDTPYVNLNYISENTNTFPLFFSKNKNIDIVYFNRDSICQDIAADTSSEKSAYIRLEDICASGASSERYSDNGLAKLRIMSDYMARNGQQFYIALIMWYKNPDLSIDNDLTKNVHLYNASFIFTIDYMRANGGKIVLHGLTHQFGDSVSADGDEYGKTGSYSSDEACRNRMKETIETAKKLGWEYNAFEFPHYTATKKQLKIAEDYFDIIYQQKQPTKTPGKIETVSKGDRNIAYIPTPADYVQSVYDKDGMVQRLLDSADKNQEVSLFFHPSLDFNLIFYSISDSRQLSVTYDSESILRTIIRNISDRGYSFKLL